jgi:hypothetical protein
MKKYIEISNETLQAIMDGKCVEGSLRKDECTGRISFRAYNRKPKTMRQNRLLRVLEHGWVKESAERIKVYESLPKAIGPYDMCDVLDRETAKAEQTVVDWAMGLV